MNLTKYIFLKTSSRDIKLKINILEEYKDIINTDDLPENIEIIYIN